nr:MAG TPA: hypothetical protein [Caudoviricetes sp.]DAX56044.1 MAG TPA: hypothetical protein [Caudoviricetes sp.]
MPDSNRITRCLCAAPFPVGNPCFTVVLILCCFALSNKRRWDSNPHNTNASCCAVTVTIWKLPLAVGILTPFKPMKQDD